jgi:membrane protein YdbS with pleckstrin-like domain
MKMGREIKGKVIKPPISNVTSGKVFKPSKAFLHKEWTKGVVAATSIWLGSLVGFVLLANFLAFVEPVDYPSAALLFNTWIRPLNYWMIVLNLIWLIPALFIIPLYVNSVEFSVKAESGETMPEVYVKRGIVTVTRKHVPFRTITNISSKAGAFDRLFGIGSVNIETAGFSGANQTGPEEKLEGIVFYEEVRDFILNELRRFRDPYVTGTEVVLPVDEPVPRGPGLDDEMLITLREIRDLLRGAKRM